MRTINKGRKLCMKFIPKKYTPAKCDKFRFPFWTMLRALRSVVIDDTKFLVSVHVLLREKCRGSHWYHETSNALWEM